MAKAVKKTKVKPESESFLSKLSLDELIPQKHHILIVIVILFLLFLIFLSPMYFGSKTFYSGDIVSTEAMKPYIEQERDGYSLWNPLIFCGIPAYAVGTEFTWYNFIYVGFTAVRELFTSLFAVDYTRWSFYLIIMSITTFFFMRYLTRNTLVSLFTAVATGFSTGIVVFLFIGHVTKLTSLCMYPLIFLMLLRMQEKIRLLDFLILIVALQLFIQGFHVQIIFYTLFAVAIYYIYFFVRAVSRKEVQMRNNLLKSAGLFIIASVIAVLIQSDNLTQIYEYTPYSTRGAESIVEQTTGKAAQTESEYYAYHTEWSFSPAEVLTFIVPSYFGFGNSTYKGELTGGQEVEVNTYFGQMRFVDVAMYMGVLVFFLALFGIITRWKEPFVQFLTILSGIALLISFGKNFPVLFDLMFYYFPYFDKFRVPSMILVIVQMSLPVLAGFGLMKIISLQKEKNENLSKALKKIAFVFSAVFIISLLLNSPIKDWFISRVNDYAAGLEAVNRQMAQQYRALSGYAADMFVTDLILAMLFVTAAAWGVVMVSRKKLSADVFVILVIVLSLIDLWRIDARGAKYIDAVDKENLFAEPQYVRVINQQNDQQPFRILNLKQDRSIGSFGNNANFNAYFLLEDFYGYSGIKPRAYQDLMDVIGPVNQTLWNMLNVKYLITSEPAPFVGFTQIYAGEGEFVSVNENVLPRVYLVEDVNKIENMSFLTKLRNNEFDPVKVAFIHDRELNVDNPDTTAYANIINYTEARITLDVKATGNNLLFFGTTYVPGWKAFIGEDETEVFRMNHGFMGIIVPPGMHNVEFRYAPDSYYISRNIALALSSIVVLGIVILIPVEMNRSRKKNKSV